MTAMTYSIGNISTSQFYDRGNRAMGGLSTKADALQTQIATGKRLVAPSADSVAFQRLQGLKRAGADDAAYAGNLDVAADGLRQADTTLGAIGEQLTRASELAIQARSGTQSDASRRAIAAELDAIIENLAGLANVKDSRGQYIFGDSEGGPAATKQADGSYALATTVGGAIPIGEGQSITAGEAAGRVLKVGDSDALARIAELSAALKAGQPEDSVLKDAVDDIQAAGTQASTIQATLGARAARVELEQSRLTDVAADREEVRSSLEDTDISQAVIELQKTMTILSATQASFAKLQGLSLFDYLR